MGRADGRPPPQNPGCLPRLPRGHPRRTSYTATTMSTGEPDATEIGHVRFGGGPSEKGLVTGTSLAAYPTARRDLREPEGEILPATQPCPKPLPRWCGVEPCGASGSLRVCRLAEAAFGESNGRTAICAR